MLVQYCYHGWLSLHQSEECSKILTNVFLGMFLFWEGGPKQTTSFPHSFSEMAQPALNFSGVGPHARGWVHKGLFKMFDGNSESCIRREVVTISKIAELDMKISIYPVRSVCGCLSNIPQFLFGPVCFNLILRWKIVFFVQQYHSK